MGIYSLQHRQHHHHQHHQHRHHPAQQASLQFQVFVFLVVSSWLGVTVVRAMAIPPNQQLTQQQDSQDFYRPDKTLMIAKKSATALNKLMIALRSYEKGSSEKGNGMDSLDLLGRAGPSFDTLSLQRRNQKDRKIYLRCYFNAVSCF